MNTQKKEKGFTIIEVVLVLAIAGLIFLMVFLALPALQRNQRDTQRKNDLSRAQTAVTSFTSNNRGSLPANAAAWTNLVTNYLSNGAAGSDSFLDPSGANSTTPAATTYKFTPSGTGTTGVLAGPFSSITNQNVIFYTTSATCGNGGGDTILAGTRKVALRMNLEGGGIACVNN